MHTHHYNNIMMTRWLSFAAFVAVATCHNQIIDALVTPSARNMYYRGHTVPLLLEYSRESELFLHQRRHNQHATALRSVTEAATNGANRDISTEEVDDDDDELPHDDFEPRTMKVFESFAFFARFTVQSILEKRAMKSQDGTNRRRLRQRLKQLIFRRKKEHNVIETIKATKKQPDEKTGIRGSLSGLNESRKNLTRLVGYDSSLLLPAFTYLVLGALCSSIVPHYYSACISCVAAGEPNRAKLIWAIGGLGLSHVAEALFTGFRGALFWIAGTLPCIYRKY